MEGTWSIWKFDSLRLRFEFLLLLQSIFDEFLLNFNFVARTNVGQDHEERNEYTQNDAPNEYKIRSWNATRPHEETVA